MGVLISCAPAVQNLTDGQGITRSRGDSEGIEASARVRVLGIAQDGGFPHASCHCQRCDLARNDPSVRSGVSSLGVITEDDRVFLFDATPDIHRQLDLLSGRGAPPISGVDRHPLDGVFLTHAHMGHYLGLALLGFEAISVRDLPVWSTPEMASFLRDNAPWDRLVSQGHIAQRVVNGTQKVALSPALDVSPLHVPHRAEYTDTVGYYIQGPSKRLLFIPDSAPWERWETPFEDALEGVDVALLDGTFYSGDELPDRDLSTIGHPLMVDTMDRLQSMVDQGLLDVFFIHLNHSNPAIVPGSDAWKEVRRRGFHVAHEGLDFIL